MYKPGFCAAVVIAVLLGLAAQANASPQAYESTLPNGLRVIMLPDSRAEMAASYVIVNAAVRYETPEINGATHFLEHMLFNGTGKLTQEQLYAEVDRLGAFNNAFTRKDFTAYMIFAPSHTFAEAFALQADMLLDSTLPPEKLEKERGIIIEEINQGLGNPDEQVYDAWQRILWASTPYEMTVLGPKQVISTISREAIMEYYHSHYAPNGMTILLLGDFAPQEMMQLVQSAYGNALPKSQAKPGFTFKPAKPGLVTQYFSGITPSVNFAVALPGNSLGANAALPFGSELLSERLSAQLGALAGHEVTVSVSIDSYIEGGYLSGSFPAQDEHEARKLANAIPALLAEATAPPDDAWLARKKREMLAREMKVFDNFFFFGMDKAPLIAQGKWEFARSLTELTSQVAADQVYGELAKLNLESQTTVFLALPYTEESARRRVESASKRVVMDNGLTLLVKSDPRSGVFGASVVFRNRSFAEPNGRCGLAELWQRVLMQGPAGMPKESFDQRLSELGLSIEFVDNPYIPMDDIYLSGRYSFIKAEGLDECWRDNLGLLAGIISSPKLDEAALAEAKRSLMQVLGMKSGSTRERARALFLGGILGDSPLAKPVEGIASEAGMATLDELRAFADVYAVGGNVIVSIATSAPLEDVVREAKGLLEALPAGPAVAANPPLPAKPSEAAQEGGAPQAAIYYGYAFPGLEAADRAALIILGGIISDRAAFVIREQQGLAYSVGAGFDNFGGTGWFSLAMGTGPDNIDQAKSAILTTLEGLKSAAITEGEVVRGVNSLLGRRIMRRITRKNQAFFAATSELLGEADSDLDNALRQVRLADVLRARDKYFHPELGVFVIVK